ncbi:Gfo/Idh/MocA family protein [Undibacter mobilis]|uniref:Gfo/Idh/MocA family oxidoreductase n=1 Tax=Undibacter mobilis TaxID=2292256 RepID=A0A371B195_9BRAD|nr:Gfo/Idh/MocA family oxidoreductase [Undibacter mobilis]RDV01231.1 gfo/Idh/MocA family oxidoreductase [Undibacter mobilis]
MAKHRVGIVGLGMALKPHLKSLEELSGRVDIAACFTPSIERRKAFAAANSHPVVDSLDAILSDTSIDVVFVLTPPMSHLDLVEQCAAAGKHVLLEKPIDFTSARGEKQVAAMDKSGRTFAVMLQHRFRDASRKLRAAVQSGELGDLVSASASIRWWRTPEYFAQAGRGMKVRDGGGVLITQAIHTLDLFQSLTGPIARVTAFAKTSPLRKIDTEDIAAGAVEFRNGAIGTIDATTVSYPGFPEKLELACTNATAVLNAETLDIYFKDGRHVHHEGAASKSGGADPMAFPNDAHKGLIVDFLDAIDNKREPESSGRESLKVMRLIEAMLASAEQGQPVSIG